MKDKEGRNGARRYMAEELYVENTEYPYLTSCSGDFLYLLMQELRQFYFPMYLAFIL